MGPDEDGTKLHRKFERAVGTKCTSLAGSASQGSATRRSGLHSSASACSLPGPAGRSESPPR